MIRGKLAAFLFSVLMLAGAVSAGFYVIEEGEKKKVGPSKESKAEVSPRTTSRDRGLLDPSMFVNISGDVMQGALDMSGFGLTGLPSPENPGDAATKEYVDDNAVSVETGNASPETSGIGEVLQEDNQASKSLDMGFHGLLKVGNINPGGNGLRIGGPADFMGNDLFSSQGELRLDDEVSVAGDTRIQGDLVVEGELEDVNASSTGDRSGNITGTVVENVTEITKVIERTPFSGTVETGVNGIRVSVPEKYRNTSYTVTATPVDSLEDVGVFDQNSTGFTLRATASTEVNYMVSR